MKALTLLLLSCACCSAFAQRMSVHVLERRDQETGYHGYVPGRSSGNSTGSTNCNDYAGSINCQSSGYNTSYYTEPHINAYNVTGTTLSLVLPDGRIAIANCASKYAPKGDYVNRRSCRIPLVEDLDADFKGKNVKLYWSVSIDGRKSESETYKILAVLPAPPPQQSNPPTSPVAPQKTSP
jgi:hypothetical protein